MRIRRNHNFFFPITQFGKVVEMKISIISIAIVVLFVLLCTSPSFAADEPFKDMQSWTDEGGSEAYFTYLESTITVTIKNNNDHVQYFKISQKYNQTSPPITWEVVSTNPCALKMIKYERDIDSNDLGWKVQAGETKTVSFKLRAWPVPSNILPAYIRRNSTMNNSFWPLVNEPGLTATWFLPNELEYLNPSLEIVSWKGHFCFWIKNFDTKRPKVSGIVRAPIVPVDSKLTYSNPQVTYVDKELPWADTAAWDVLFYPGQSKHFSYTYVWPKNTSSQASGSVDSTYGFPKTAATQTATSVPTKSTGAPFALFVVAAIIIAAGVSYAKFFR